ncbi:MAG TPA: terminase family protein [Myxococcota bacterium]|jgi:hypothetical protein|nr:terminase family protein [Myxococcota bacterium]
MDFHRSTAKWRLLLGSNRSGKTLAAAVELARAVLGKDPQGKYRPTNGYAVVVGLDFDHIGMLWRKLTLPDMVSIPPGCKRKSMPPLLPQSQIEKPIAWEDKARAVPRLVKFTNGWRILFVSSRGSMKQGEHYDLVWIDEQIVNPQIFWEMARGIVDVDPRWKSYGIWSATPQRQNPLLWELQQRSLESDDVQVFQLLIGDNPYISESEKAWFADFLPDQERRVRIDGQFALETWRIYPQLDIHTKHGVEPFQIPSDWTCYLSLDPGTAFCGTIFGAVPPDQSCLYIFDELLLTNTDALQWAATIKDRYADWAWEVWIIDKRAGRARTMGTQVQVAAQYRQAALDLGLSPRVTGPLCGFMPGLDDVEARREEVRRLLTQTDEPGVMGIKFFRGRTKQLIYQMNVAQLDERNPKKRINGHFDLLDALEYLVAYRPTFMPKRQVVEIASKSIYDRFLESRFARRQSHRGLGISVG